MSTPTPSRFASQISSFDPSILLRELHKYLLLSLILAVIVHLCAIIINPLDEAVETAPRPMSTKFIKREPRMTKPLELRKVPKPKRQMIQRKSMITRARMDQVKATASFSTVSALNVTSGPTMNIARTDQIDSIELTPNIDAVDLSGTRQPDNKIDMALEMLDVNSMDTGRYRAMLVQDPGDPQAIKGFINFARVVSASALASGTAGGATNGLRFLVNGLNEYTGINADFMGSITYDDERLLEIPIILPSGSPNESELEQMTRYLTSGGFIFGGIGFVHEGLEKYAGLVEGRDFWSERLPDDHPVFSSYFDFKGGAPTSTRGVSSNKNQNAWQYTTGHFIKGRLVGINFSLGLGFTGSASGQDKLRQMQMAINVIVYALTQEGSMTQRLMQMVN
tara:strand:- start:1043 stop:2224 length:1182 start_codon:yes stop_codon:yes gene_type:complete